MKIKFMVLVLFAIMVIGLSIVPGCSEGDDPVNLEIISISSNPETVAPMRESMLYAELDYDGDASPYYLWQTPDGGTVHSMGDSAVWDAPDTQGVFGVVLEVSASGVSDVDTIYILVDAAGSGYYDYLVIDSLIASAETLRTETQTVIKVFYTYDGENIVEFNWAGSGSFAEAADSAVWTAPAYAGNYTITAQVIAGDLSDMADITLNVYDSIPPVHLEITSLEADADSVPRRGSIGIHSEVEYNRATHLLYDWFVEAGSITDGEDVTFYAPDSVGTFWVMLIVTEAFGDKSDTATIDIRVLDIDLEDTLDIRTMHMTPPEVGTLDTAIISSEVYYNGLNPLEYIWNIDGGSIIGDTSSVTWVTPETPGTYRLSLRVTDGVLVDSQRVSLEVMHTLRITDIVFSPESVGVGLETDLTAEYIYTGTDSIDWEWYISAGMIESSGNEAHYRATNAPTSIKVGVIASDGILADTLEETFRVYVPPEDTLWITSMIAEPDSIVNDGSIEHPSALIFSEIYYTGDAMVDYDWSASGGTVSGTTVSAIWRPGSEEWGSFWVYLEVDAADLYDIDSVRVHYYPELEDSLIIIGIIPTPSSIGLGGTSIIHSDVFYTGDSLLEYQWNSIGGSITTGADTARFTADLEGIYPIRLVATDGAIADTMMDSIRVLDISVDSLFIVSFTTDRDSILEGEHVNLEADIFYTGDGSVSYSWEYDDGILDTYGTHGRWTAPMRGGDYRVWFIATDDSLYDTAFVEIKVTELVDSLNINDVYVASGNPFVNSEMQICADVEYTGEDTLDFYWCAEVCWITEDSSCAVWETPPDSGRYYVTVTVTDGVLSDMDTIWFDVIDPGTIEITSYEASAYNVLSYDTVRFEMTALYTGPHTLNYDWITDRGAITNYEAGRRIMYWEAPPYNVTAHIGAVAFDGVIADTQFISISVTETVDSLIIGHVTHSPDTGIPGEPVEVIAAISSVGGTPELTWSSTAGSFSPIDEATTYWTPPDEFGTYPLTISADMPPFHEDTTIHIIVYDRSRDTLEIDPLPLLEVFVEEILVIDPEIRYNRGEALRYEWSADGGRFISESDIARWTALDSGLYHIRLEVTDGFLSDEQIFEVSATYNRYTDDIEVSPEIVVLEVGETVTLDVTVFDNYDAIVTDPMLEYRVLGDAIEWDEGTMTATAVLASEYPASIEVTADTVVDATTYIYVWDMIPDTVLAEPATANTAIDATARVDLTLWSTSHDSEVEYAPWMETYWPHHCEYFAEITFDPEVGLEFDGIREGSCLFDFSVRMPARDTLDVYIPLTVIDEPVFGYVRGIVQDEEGDPVEGALIEMETGLLTPAYEYQTTDESGVFDYDSVVTGRRGVEVTKDGYLPLHTTIDVVSPGVSDAILILIEH